MESSARERDREDFADAASGRRLTGAGAPPSREAFRRFIDEHVRPRIATGRVPLDREIYAALGRAGFYHSSHPTSAGGYADRHATLGALTELGESCLPGFSFWVHGEIFCSLLLNHAPPALRDRYGSACLAGDCIGCIGLTEAGGGSSLTAIAATAEETSAGYALSGHKRFVSLGGCADVMIASAKRAGEMAPSLYLVDLKTPGVTITAVRNSFAMRELDMAHVSLDNVPVPFDHVLVRNATFPLIRTLTLERFICSVIAQAMLRRVVAGAIDHLKRHRVGGAALMSYQTMRFEASRQVAQMRSVELLVADEAAKYLAGDRISPEAAATCKLQAVNALKEAAAFLVSIHGARGVVGDDAKLGLLNDAFAQATYGGTTEVMLELIGNAL